MHVWLWDSSGTVRRYLLTVFPLSSRLSDLESKCPKGWRTARIWSTSSSFIYVFVCLPPLQRRLIITPTLRLAKRKLHWFTKIPELLDLHTVKKVACRVTNYCIAKLADKWRLTANLVIWMGRLQARAKIL